MKPIVFAPAGSLTDSMFDKLEDNGYLVVWSHGDKIPSLEIETLRDKLAAAALQGLLAGPKTLNGRSDVSTSDYAKTAYNAADAMLIERSKP